jgi:Protein of unknown function (DUF1615)
LRDLGCRRPPIAALAVLAVFASLTGCFAQRGAETPATTAAQPQARIDSALPASVRDRAGWTADLISGFKALGIDPNREHVCAVVAVIEQESGFTVDPVIPNLGAIAWKEIDVRAERMFIPRALVHSVLQLKSPTGRSYGDRIDHARTERELSDVYEDFIASVPLGRTLFAESNPIRTRGPMQVNVAFAEQFAARKTYPYPVKQSVADEVFTRRGSLYFGIAHLLDYQAPYDRTLYRFADYNAGQYASRNAAFQSAVAQLTNSALLADGALLPHDSSVDNPGGTEAAVRALKARLKLSERAMRSDLEQGKFEEFERTALYQRVFAAADAQAGHRLPRAMLPQIELHSPKITRKLSTAWYAKRVDERFSRCLSSTTE